MKTQGTYRVLLVGGDRSAKGRVEVRVAGADAKAFEFSNGDEIRTVATVTVSTSE